MFPAKKIQKLVGTRIQVEMKGEKFVLEGLL
ncbi:MAG TPA: LSM domain-containing protein, partial [Methanomicrobia archaeon]|nr:LSM domain-containing protein [Methanomicrobia archaeon]HEX59706.1 LSM domain-containing protein [Methanomicrobia archaeon]